VGRDHKNCDKHLAEIAFAYNTATSAVTGYSPAFQNSGREPIHPGTPRYDGQYIVIALSSPVIATLAHTESEETRQAHIGDMKPYVSREDTPRCPRGRPRLASEEASDDLPLSRPHTRTARAFKAPVDQKDESDVRRKDNEGTND
jgi:hypothetical protein